MGGGGGVGGAHKAVAHAVYLRGDDWERADVSPFRHVMWWGVVALW